MKRKITIVISAVCLLTLGCKSSTEAFLEEYIDAKNEIVRTVNANPTAEGVKQAQVYLNSKKASLKSKFAASRKERSDKDMEEKFDFLVPRLLQNVLDLSEKHPHLKSELGNLTKDFGEIVLKQ